MERVVCSGDNVYNAKFRMLLVIALYETHLVVAIILAISSLLAERSDTFVGTQISCFNLSQINALSKSLGEYMTGSEITRLLMQCGIQDTSGESTKWNCFTIW